MDIDTPMDAAAAMQEIKRLQRAVVSLENINSIQADTLTAKDLEVDALNQRLRIADPDGETLEEIHEYWGPTD